MTPTTPQIEQLHKQAQRLQGSVDNLIDRALQLHYAQQDIARRIEALRAAHAKE